MDKAGLLAIIDEYMERTAELGLESRGWRRAMDGLIALRLRVASARTDQEATAIELEHFMPRNLRGAGSMPKCAIEARHTSRGEFDDLQYAISHGHMAVEDVLDLLQRERGVAKCRRAAPSYKPTRLEELAAKGVTIYPCPPSDRLVVYPGCVERLFFNVHDAMCALALRWPKSNAEHFQFNSLRIGLYEYVPTYSQNAWMSATAFSGACLLPEDRSEDFEDVSIFFGAGVLLHPSVPVMLQVKNTSLASEFPEVTLMISGPEWRSGASGG